jgi:hypothetical protein
MNLTENLIHSENERDWRITANTCMATYKSSGGKLLYGACGEGDQ